MILNTKVQNSLKLESLQGKVFCNNSFQSYEQVYITSKIEVQKGRKRF